MKKFYYKVPKKKSSCNAEKKESLVFNTFQTLFKKPWFILLIL